MDGIDWESAAELFPSRSRKARYQLSYRRFDRAAEAVRFAVEELPRELFAGAYLEVEEGRFDAVGIRRLYESGSFPLARRAVARAG
ncbi:MAG: hypothetical protein HXX10_21245 [Rhodoplanes sp.]|uniref:hypothetical protein n=1 Tax=Rhodoplanes sp. TaxID=1968906 RepID=UPI0017D025AF|nr:hypothetical protein [Rhodoplanes sp.]NVO16561.1 hypothetical protein [Rhodoplanes sp.]